MPEDAGQVVQALYKTYRIIAKARSSNILWGSLKAQANVAQILPKHPILDM